MILERLVTRVLGIGRAALVLRHCELGEHVFVGGPIHVEAGGRIAIGARTQLGGGMFATELICAPAATLTIGPGCVFNYGVSIRASRSVSIGARCSLATLVRIRDDDGRTLAPVVIGDDVWLAHGVIVEPGVHIGDGAVVAAGSVVTADVPPRSLASGNPARSVPLAFFAAKPA